MKVIRSSQHIAPLIVFNLLLLTGGLVAEETGPDTLTGTWTPPLKLEEHGVKPFAVFTGELWGNVSGGIETGSRWNTFLDFGFELDTEKLGWWNGGTFMAQGHWVKNQNNDCFDNLTGAANPISGIIASDHVRVYNLYYRHAWLDDAYSLKLGQIAADDDFMGSDYSSLFLNSVYGAMPSQVGTWLGSRCNYTPAFPVWPVAGPGVFLSARPIENLHMQLGIYHGRPGDDAEDNYGFDWQTDSHTGVGVFYEAGYSYSLGPKHPGTVRLGGTYHSGLFDDYPRLNAGISDAAMEGVYSFYAINDLVLLADEEEKPVIGMFWRGGISPQTDRSVVTAYTDVGFNWFSPLPGREDDVAGVAFSYMGYGDDFRKSTAGGAVASSESTIELTYRAQITRWFALQADAQFLFNPAVNSKSNERETATVLGLRAELSF